MGYDFEKIFDEIEDLLNRRDRREGEFTTNEYAAHHKKTRSWAVQRLSKAVADGLLTRRKAVVEGHFCNLYTFVEKDS